jgi:transcriptional regulator of acetoin/glycerol metabolism
MINFFDNKKGVISASKVDIADLKTISLYKDQFLLNSQDPGVFSLVEPEVAASWKRSQKLQVNPQMQELTDVLRPQELKALLRDKKMFVDLTKSYFSTLLPLLNIPRTTLTVHDENGTLLDLFDPAHLLRLNIRSGSVWREETVGTTSTSLCVEYKKIVQLAGSKHYCKALEHQIGTTAPVHDEQGNRLGVITIIHHADEVKLNAETIQRILLWLSTLRTMVETQLVLLKSSYMLGGDALFAVKNDAERSRQACRLFQNKKALSAGAFPPLKSLGFFTMLFMSALISACLFPCGRP